MQCLAGPWIRLRHSSSEAQSEKRVPGRKPLHRIIQLPPTASACAGIPMALSACAAYQQFLSTCVRHNGRRLPSMTVVAKLAGSNVLTERDVVDHALIFSCLIKWPMSAITTQDLLDLWGFLEAHSCDAILGSVNFVVSHSPAKETWVLPFSDDRLWSPQRPESGSCTRRR